MKQKPPKDIKAIKGLKAVPPCSLTDTAGVYFLCSKGKVVFVGRSLCIERRIGSILNDRYRIMKFDEAYYIALPSGRILSEWTRLRRLLTQPK